MIRQFVAPSRRIAHARARQDFHRTTDIAARTAFGEKTRGTDGGQLLRHRDINELVQRDACFLGQLAFMAGDALSLAALTIVPHLAICRPVTP